MILQDESSVKFILFFFSFFLIIILLYHLRVQ